jgi:hypothetical protein
MAIQQLLVSIALKTPLYSTQQMWHNSSKSLAPVESNLTSSINEIEWGKKIIQKQLHISHSLFT